GAQTGKMLIGLERFFQQTEPDVVLVQGDTNTVLAGALAAVKLNIAVGHVEAGLRSFDRTMPEEVNRVMADHISDMLFSPTAVSADNLRAEGIADDKIHITGNTIVDAVRENLHLAAEKGDALTSLGLVKGEYIMTTMHRQENVDSPARMKNVLQGMEKVNQNTGLEIVWPIHPRARKNLERFQLSLPPGVKVIQPLGFLEFLQVEGNAALALTDSGGVQEECCILGVPCVTLRDNTERPETVLVGANKIVGTDPVSMADGVRDMLGRDGWICPLGEDGAGTRIVKICREFRKTWA
ncbi:MAG: UDP-N-acetylglucosamine 2-epimerase (non-hydrolyzing), partial [Methanomassiliicoccales archaeon]|nr:UDP-N-acetylglucosamine 2-epimerase (non-hydrolyzing) [Methanomassiliicoccales archaeon]